MTTSSRQPLPVSRKSAAKADRSANSSQQENTSVGKFPKQPKSKNLVREKVSDKKGESLMSSKKTDVSPATSMDELMARKEGEFTVPKRGATIHGTVTDITNRMILVNIGAKTEGMVSDRNFDEARDFTKSLGVGDEVDAYVLTPENERGQILLSLRQAAQDWQWKKLAQWMKTGEVIEVRGLDVNKGGIIARIDSMDIQGFVPTSQLGGTLVGRLDDLVNRVFSVRIIEVDRKNNRLIFSEKHVSEQGQIEARKEVLKGLTVGMKLRAKVVGLTDFGAFAKVNVDGKELEGLIHISELSWDKIDDPSLVVREGDEVEVLVVEIHPEVGKVGFSLKQLTDDPWKNIEERYPPGKKLSGVVMKIASFGAIVQLEPGVSGLLHISKIPTKKEPAVGDSIEVTVEDLDAEHRKLALGMVMDDTPIIYR